MGLRRATGLHAQTQPHRGKQEPAAIVVGGGISGLLAARELAESGVRVSLLEQQDHLGGAVSAHEVGGLLLDSGAESYATRTPSVTELVQELGLEEHMITPNPNGSWLYLPSGARKTPSTGIMGIPGNLDDKTLTGVLGKAGARRAKLDKVLPASVGAKAKTLGELVRARMGKKVLDNLVAPVVSGVYSAHPDQLDVEATIPGLREGLKKYGSLAAASAALRAQAPAGSQVASLAGGLNQLSEKLIEDLYAKGARIITGFDVIAIDRDTITGEWFVIQRHTADGEIQATVRGDYLVLATDGPTTARLLGSHMKTSLPTIEPGPEVALVTLVLEHPSLNAHPRGTGLLVSEKVANVRAKALTHATAKWPWLAQAAGKNKHVVRLSYGRGGENANISDVALADEQLITLALHDASKLLDVPITSHNLVDADVVRWRSVLPHTAPGHADRVCTFRERVSELGTVCTVGSWAAGSGLAATVRDTRKQVAEFLTHNTETNKKVAQKQPEAELNPPKKGK